MIQKKKITVFISFSINALDSVFKLKLIDLKLFFNIELSSIFGVPSQSSATSAKFSIEFATAS